MNVITTLKDTTTADIQNTITKARQELGAATGMVFTLLVVAPASDFDAVFDACVEAGREHPSRIIVATNGSAKADRLDAELHLGEAVPGEIIALKFHGEVAAHKPSTLLPLLLPDSPVIAWWPGVAPDPMSQDEIGALASRRVTDAMGSKNPLDALVRRAADLAPGDTDLTWTRLTPWRALLAAALDQNPVPIRSASVSAAGNNAGGLLLSAWLRSRLGVDVHFEPGDGPGITRVALATDDGEITLERPDGRMATVTGPNTPPRRVALRRRKVSALITDELRMLDPDEVFLAAMADLLADVAPSTDADA